MSEIVTFPLFLQFRLDSHRLSNYLFSVFSYVGSFQVFTKKVVRRLHKPSGHCQPWRICRLHLQESGALLSASHAEHPPLRLTAVLCTRLAGLVDNQLAMVLAFFIHRKFMAMLRGSIRDWQNTFRFSPARQTIQTMESYLFHSFWYSVFMWWTLDLRVTTIGTGPTEPNSNRFRVTERISILSLNFFSSFSFLSRYFCLR